LIVLDLNIGDHTTVAWTRCRAVLSDCLCNLRLAGAHHAILELDSLVALGQHDARKHALGLEAPHYQQPGLARHTWGLIGICSLGALREQRVRRAGTNEYRQQERCSYKQRMAMAIHQGPRLAEIICLIRNDNDTSL